MANWGIDIGISGAIVYCDIKLEAILSTSSAASVLGAYARRGI